ncbi:MAG: prenyltransferase/squalene oxidase repeat-containing protein [Anaerolineae bacterium]
MTWEEILGALAPGQSRMSSSPYDSAWVARLNESQLTEPAREWLVAHQLPDGGWGASWPVWYPDRFASTLAAVVAMAETGDPASDHVLRASQALSEYGERIGQGDYTRWPIGFEMIVPTLAEQLRSVPGLEKVPALNGTWMSTMNYARFRKLQALRAVGGVISRDVTLAFSAEMAGDDHHLLSIDSLQSANGSVDYSPSATAYFAGITGARSALDYLSGIVHDDGGAPVVAPSDVFEVGWVLWNLSLLRDVDDGLLTQCQPLLDWLQGLWNPIGVPQAEGYTPTDSDDTALTYTVLSRLGRTVDIEPILRFEEKTHFRCFSLEADPSISANIHVLEALVTGGYTKKNASVWKVLEFLRGRQHRGFWRDKWHLSPYYATAHALIAYSGQFDDEWLRAMSWLMATQRDDGGWGFFGRSTAEETAYALQALTIWQRQSGVVPPDMIQRGAGWLGEHGDPPYPPLWIGKGLYCPELVVQSAVLSALALAAE